MQTNHWIFHISVTYNNHLMIRIVDFLVDFALLEPLELWDPGPMSEQPPLGGCHSFLEGISTVDAMENPALLDSCIEVPLKHLRFVLIWNPSSSSSLSPHTFYYGACVMCLRQPRPVCSSYVQSSRTRRAWMIVHKRQARSSLCEPMDG